MSHSQKRLGVDVIVDGVEKTPSCLHGPTLLFEKFTGTDSSGRRFYACSAFRDRKDCSFFQWADETISQAKISAREARYKQLQPLSHKKLAKRLARLEKLKDGEITLCQACGLLLFPEELSQHRDHKLTCSVSYDQLDRPTSLFQPWDNNKTYAQYLFSAGSVEFIIGVIQKLGFNKVLCVGAPRIHEEVVIQRKNNSSSKLKSLLLDLDHRFKQIWPPELFCQYNMFNHHFFEGAESEGVFTRFIQGDGLDGEGNRVVIVMDPPFGGMVEALSATLNKISQTCCRETSEDNACPVLWFFPYFMEKKIEEVCPDLKMLDYKVDYDNHGLFHREEKGRKQGSPVRIFTNLPPAKVVLPKDEGYWFCGKCKRYSSPENWHCKECGRCTSKDGTRYVHCDRCKRCVKPSRVHCDSCDLCDLPQHKCGQHKLTGCHICGDMGHKRRDCPQRKSADDQIHRKRKGDKRNKTGLSKKKKK